MNTIDWTAYNAKTEAALAAFRPRIEAFLNRVREYIAKVEPQWTVGEIDFWDYEEYEWHFQVFFGAPTDAERSADIEFKIAESKVHEGSEDGINFMLGIFGWGGLILGGIAPFNYTSACWVAFEEIAELDFRMRIFEDVDLMEIVGCLLEAETV